MKIKESFGAAARAGLAVIVILAGCQHGSGGAMAGSGWPQYVGFNGEAGALSVGEVAGKYLDTIKGRADADPSLLDPLKTQIKNRCDELQNKKFQAYTNDETYLILVIAERHSAAQKWDRVWKRLGGTTATAPSWGPAYKPSSTKLAGYNTDVESLLDAIKAKFPSNATIQNRCAALLMNPHSGTSSNASWARILFANELAVSKADLVGMELDHPEGTTS
ncbi:MAG: hypothetical protein V3T86_05490 [Planctomycetota bacterium]